MLPRLSRSCSIERCVGTVSSHPSTRRETVPSIVEARIVEARQMILTAERQWMVAIAYEKAAADTIGVPAPQRAAFARKAKRFRTLARIAAKIEATTVVKQVSCHACLRF